MFEPRATKRPQDVFSVLQRSTIHALIIYRRVCGDIMHHLGFACIRLTLEVDKLLNTDWSKIISWAVLNSTPPPSET
jgi:hypothetical protein